ncbi:hypothetical protein HHI36_003099 [Cryptolaemus montrouzieri]|uniref:Uncharacterized protein n=1 Tax=Cryptolaemus montrouzieri TaxID=559131 RepID=A0ABD2PDE0_9CUCU
MCGSYFFKLIALVCLFLLAALVNPSNGKGFQQHSERGPFGGGSKPSRGSDRLGGNNNNIGRGGNNRF